MTLDESQMRAPWRDRAPAMLRSTAGPDGEPCATPLDRRWLWRLEMFLSISGTTDVHRAMSRDLREYLNETCEHHWQHWTGDEMYPQHWQCLWCNDMTQEQPS